jgi:hypothetical protein
MKRSDNMVISTLRGYNRGINPNHSSSVRGHLRPLNYHSSSAEFMWPDMLHIVGGRVGASGDTSNLCDFRLSYGRHKGEEQCNSFQK